MLRPEWRGQVSYVGGGASVLALARMHTQQVVVGGTWMVVL